ncbi:hypothetical protein QLL95_gp1085 [Cotonvirus japonicus]|uniref:Uncharacterized protein n=1 Tax=Cotonvirus japonicus TaxID=2811091 RepID=A0ABM7NSA6_9VIRU|nr:hypothetical protein QLL95_gp1085 [Cotonvirus japonicus]BCS83038.1 hypothetical protein [Cotonvirus japonicus]
MSFITSYQIKNLVILIIFLVLLWLLYFYFIKNKYNFGNTKIAVVPMEVKCLFKEQGCDDGDIDTWSLIQAFIYFIVGLIIPDKYLLIVMIIIILEIIKPFFGFKPKYIINPLLNVTGYAFGSFLSQTKNKQKYTEKYKLFCE